MNDRQDHDLPEQPQMPRATPPGALARASDADPCPALPAHHERLADRARGYVDAASSANTRRAYASDWRHFVSWCRRQALDAQTPDPQTVGLYITACGGASASNRKPNSVSTIERRLSSLAWNYAQRGLFLDRKDRHIATVMAGFATAMPDRPSERGGPAGRHSRHAGHT
jgi:hypothetical protein